MKRSIVMMFAVVLASCIAIFSIPQTVCAQVKALEADTVIIGGGGAGTAAALTAIQNGIKRVIILEKEAFLGGFSAMAGGFIWGAETPVQKAAGIKTSKEEAFKEFMEFNHYDRVDPKVVRAFIEKTADTMKWLEDNGITYAVTPKAIEIPDHTPYTQYPTDMTGPINNYGRSIKKLSDKFTTLGGQVLLNTSAEKILRGPDGRINGVVAANKKGETILINARTVILASGGFAGNEALLYKYFPEYWDSEAFGGARAMNRGDGIKLAEDAGAGLNNWATLIKEPPRTSSATLWVNKRGERFQNETWRGNASANALAKQPGKIGFALFDAKTAEGSPDENDLKTEQSMPKSDSKVSNTWDEIAQWIGADPKVLKATIEEYNSFCKQGCDPVFGKDPKFLNALLTPPFSAQKLTDMMVDTYGPVRINERMEVLDKKDKPIPGFYAGGAICGQIQGHDYHFFGGALSFAVSSGRIAAENAAKYILGK